ncbi:HesA/MoeB/ThiF family protein [Actinacidiphila bryophytorum]|uniref:HesA/MoeB/ThiF family protein n=1 Tax=Actinacidiphila bryophytorum TaxID=1436133 RepID=UPI002176CD09|nr:ThiF family adenylyltransferase [Actinacidiphila bryophytorum]UWE10191.1 ThiF family adenylyltransferase [Actinacidiphila bryophytorum]
MTTRFGVAMSTDIARRLTADLTRDDGQEECCFVLWRPSTGAQRTTALIVDTVPPLEGERIVHGTVDFTSDYFRRASDLAAEVGCGVGLIHSHPGGRGWQTLNRVDHAAEENFAAQAMALTGRPLLGMVFSGADQGHSARIWQRRARRHYAPMHAESVRVVGDQFTVTFNPRLAPVPRAVDSQVRTVSAWGPSVQDTLARLKVGVVGTGSVGMIVVEALARTGVGHLTLLDFDAVEIVNLDRLLHATQRDARRGRAKVDLAAQAARRAATHPAFRVTALEASVVEPAGFAAAADCDVLVSCVDRPWPRHVLNLLAYAHLIPVVDGGVSVATHSGSMRGAEWRGHVAAPGRACLECLGQYDAAHVATERDGMLDNPSYITGLPDDHVLRRKENVFVFSLAAASAQMNQFITMVAAPAGIADTGAHLHHLTTGTTDRREEGCTPQCPYGGTSPDEEPGGSLHLLGDSAPTLVGSHTAAERARAARRTLRARLRHLRP